MPSPSTTPKHVLLAAGALAVAAACSGSSGLDFTTTSDAGTDDASLEAAALDAASADGASSIDGASPGDVTQDSSLAGAIEAAGFDTLPGKLAFFDLSQCCQSANGCYANNPSSPYAAIWLPPGPGQTAPNPTVLTPQTDGTSAAWRLRQDEAVVFVGPTPPQAKYFGFTPYIYDRDVNGQRKSIFASMGESVNVATIGVAGGGAPFEAKTALVLTANKTTEAGVRAALLGQGIPTSAINVMVLDPSAYQTGLDADKDTFAVLLRLAEVTDESKRAAYLANPGGVVLRVTPKVAAAANAEPAPTSRKKDTTSTEASLSSSLDALESAIRARRTVGWVITSRPMSDQTPDPAQCNAQNKDCLGDSRDTTYPSTVPIPFLENPEDELYVIGPNHAATGKATYSSFAIEAVDHLVGVAARTDASFAGSAAAFLPGNPDAAKLYAYKVARACASSDPYCLAVPADGGCPTGIPAGAPVLVLARTYLEPGTGTSPDPSTLLLDRALVVHKVK